MDLIFLISLLILSHVIVDASKEIIIEKPFHLRVLIVDSHTVNVQFEIARDTHQRTCQMYQFTVRRNREPIYFMPEQNLTFWTNSLDLQHLPAGDYQVCATICSEQLQHVKYHHQLYAKTNLTTPIAACIHFRAVRPHLLVLTLYILVVIFLTVSQIIFSLRKRQFQARIKLALMEVENSLQKWRTTQPTSASIDPLQPYSILQSVVTLPVSPVHHLVSSPIQINDEEQNAPVIFHLEP